MKVLFDACFISVCLALSISGTVHTNPSATQDSYQALFEEICQIVEENFYSPAMIQREFPALKMKYESQIARISDGREFSTRINEMLRQLQTSHTYYLTPADYEYYHLSAVFAAVPKISALFENREILYPSIGVITEVLEDRYFIVSVLAGSAAEQAGFLKGDEIISVNDKPYSPIESIKDLVGEAAIFSVRRNALETLAIPVTPVSVNPKTEMLEAQKASIRIEKRDGKKIGYIHIYSYAGIEYQQELVAAITWGGLKEADALIIDLRYGLGGANVSYLNIFNRNIPVFQLIDREGKRHGFDSQWRKPAVYLVNKATRSGKELLVFGAKKHKLATIIGERTAGAVTGGKLFPLSNNDLLYLAVSSSEIDGVNLEGAGVVPDIHVPADIRYCEGKDVQFEKAVDYLAQVLKTDRGKQKQ